MGMGQNPIPLVNIKIAGKWMFIPLKMVLIGIDPYPYDTLLMIILHVLSGYDRPNTSQEPHWRPVPGRGQPGAPTVETNGGMLG